MIKRMAIIGVVILLIFVIIIIALYFFDLEKTDIVITNGSIFGSCDIDEDCGEDRHNYCRMLTYRINLPNGKSQYIKKGDSYCINWCDRSVDVCIENEKCIEFDYADGEEIKTAYGCIDPNNYQSIVEMETVDTWVE